MGIEVGGMEPREAAKAAVKAVRDMQKQVGLTDTLKKLGVPSDREALKPLVELAAGDSQITYNPHYVEEEDIYNLYLSAM